MENENVVNADAEAKRKANLDAFIDVLLSFTAEEKKHILDILHDTHDKGDTE